MKFGLAWDEMTSPIYVLVSVWSHSQESIKYSVYSRSGRLLEMLNSG